METSMTTLTPKMLKTAYWFVHLRNNDQAEENKSNCNMQDQEMIFTGCLEPK
jgi:hypothetical protein